MSEYRPKSVAVMTTSEGKSLGLLSRHNYLVTRLILNLGEEPFRELLKDLNPPGQLDFDEIWSMQGGNPRAPWKLTSFNWDLMAHRESITRRLTPIIDEIKAGD